MSDTIFHGTSGPYRIPSPWERQEKLEAMSLEQLSAELAVVEADLPLMHKCPKTFGPETIAATETEIVWMKERLKTLQAGA